MTADNAKTFPFLTLGYKKPSWDHATLFGPNHYLGTWGIHYDIIGVQRLLDPCTFGYQRLLASNEAGGLMHPHKVKN